MNTESYTTTMWVDGTPDQAFDAITNVRGWWSEEIVGRSRRPGDEFAYHHEDLHRCKIRVIDAAAGRRVEWLVLDNHFSFVKDTTEWIGTRMVFEIARRGDQTEVRFTHVGLGRWYECFDVCSNAWGFYIGESLRGLITTGEGQPNSAATSRTDDERALAQAGEGRTP